MPDHEKDNLLVRLLGSPDPLQVDGLGGGFSSTSKAMLVAPGHSNEADVSYLFAQVAVDKTLVDYTGNCGNLTSAVGPFAVDEGMVKVPNSNELSEAEVKCFNLNTKKHILVRFPTRDGSTHYRGSNDIEGVPRSGVPVEVVFLDPSGTALGSPILEPTLQVNLDGEKIDVSVVDVTSLYAFVTADALGL